MFPDTFVSSKTEFFYFQLCFYKVNISKFNYLNIFLFIYYLQLCVGMYACMWHVHVRAADTLLNTSVFNRCSENV